MARVGCGQAYRIGEVALAAGLSRKTLHEYVLLGLIRPVGRTSGGHRCFSASAVRRLDEIKSLQQEHTLAEIRDHLAARRVRPPSPRRQA